MAGLNVADGFAQDFAIDGCLYKSGEGSLTAAARCQQGAKRNIRFARDFQIPASQFTHEFTYSFMRLNTYRGFQGGRTPRRDGWGDEEVAAKTTTRASKSRPYHEKQTGRGNTTPKGANVQPVSTHTHK